MSAAGRMILKGDWKKSISAMKRFHNVNQSIDAAVFWEAHYYLTLVNEEFVRGGVARKWPKLSQITLAMRKSKEVGGRSSGGTKPLIKSGDLRRSLNVRREGFAKYFVGVHRTAKRGGYRAKSAPLVDIARVHEFGHVIVVTSRMRKFFQYLAIKGIIKAPLKKSTRILYIPRRSFMNNAMDRLKQGQAERIAANVARILGGGGGAPRARDSSGRSVKGS